MNESDFQQRADALFRRVEAAADAIDVDVDWTSGTVMELTTGQGATLVLSRQPALGEVWLAGPTGAHHYRWQDDAWRNTRDGGLFVSQIAAAGVTGLEDGA